MLTRDLGLSWWLARGVFAGLLLMFAASNEAHAQADSAPPLVELNNLISNRLPAASFDAASGQLFLAQDGTFTAGDVILSVPIRHRVTGHLQHAVEAIGWFSPRPHIAAGAGLFLTGVSTQGYFNGAPSGSPQDFAAWCGLSNRPGAAPGAGACLLESREGTWYTAEIVRGTADYPEEVSTELFPAYGAVSIVVDQQPSDRGIEFVLVYERWRRGEGQFRFGVLSQYGFAQGGSLRTNQAESGRRTLELLGGVFEVSKTERGIAISTIRPIRGTTPLAPRRVPMH